MFDFILQERCWEEPNLTLLLNTSLVGAETEDGLIQKVMALRPSTEDEFTIGASVFVDCTGDGALGVAAGAAFMNGRESREMHGESLAREEPDAKTLGSTLLLMGRRHDRPMPFIAPSWARKFSDEDLRLRPHATQEIDSGLEYGFWWIEWGGQLDTIKDNETIRDELTSIVMGVWDHIKNDGDHGAECWALDWFGAVPGKRESRRFIGQYILTEHDLMKSCPQADAIAYGGWPIDLHPPEGVDRPNELPSATTQVPYLYDIPLRSCVARDVKNLMFAGRNMSATHVAFASTRVMATCASVGEGVGVAAAYAVEKNALPSGLTSDPGALNEIRQRLMRGDAFLIGGKYFGEKDHAFSAIISASSETSDGAAQNIVSEQTRAIRGDRGVPSGREVGGTHRWISDHNKGLPAWIELRWIEPVELSQIEIVFDTGLHRHLTLTQSDAYNRQMHWGVGQPECVRDYRLEINCDRRWETVEHVKGNWQRRRIHKFPSSTRCHAVRIIIDATWGVNHARVVRVICPVMTSKQVALGLIPTSLDNVPTEA